MGRWNLQRLDPELDGTLEPGAESIRGTQAGEFNIELNACAGARRQALLCHLHAMRSTDSSSVHSRRRSIGTQARSWDSSLTT